MTAQHRPCGICRAATRNDAHLCDRCTTKFGTLLRGVPWIEGQLVLSLTREKGVALGSASARSEGLPWNEGASRALRELQGVLAHWVRFCQDNRVTGFRRTEPQPVPSALAGWLTPAIPALTLLEQAPTAYAEIDQASDACRRVIFFKPVSREYLGKCGQAVRDEVGLLILRRCPGDVYADPGAQLGYCEECGQGLAVATRKKQLEDELDDRLCTAAELSHMAVFLGLDVPRERVRKKVLYWHRHKLIEQRGTEADTDFPTFRYGDVRALLYAEYTPREA